MNTFIMDPQTTTLLIGFLTGIATATIPQVVSLIRVRNERKLRLLEDQIRELYGPLFYLVSQSEKLLELSKRIHSAYSTEFIEKKYSRDILTQERHRSEVKDTLEIANEYVHLVEANNEKISRLLDSSFFYIDPDDIELFLLYFEHSVRLDTERDDSGKIRTPLEIYEHMGEISFLKPEFIKRVKSQFQKKKQELDRLSKR